MHECQRCKEVFKTSSDFDNHSCVQEAKKLSREELLKRLLESGGCTQEYYDLAMKDLTK